MPLLLIYGNGIGSLLFGWLHWMWWLWVPPLSYIVFTFGTTMRADIRRRDMGAPYYDLTRSMSGANIGLIIRNTIIHSIIFCVAWVISSAFS